MARTFNRAPIQVNVPNKSDIKHYFLNQIDWKGMIDDKNFLSVPSESFESCNNVYVDAEGILRSRPALKIKTITDGTITLSDILDMWTYSKVTVYKYINSTKYYLAFVANSTIVSKECAENTIQLPFDDKIVIFGENEFWYYDCSTNQINDTTATDIIYIPTTTVISNGILQSETDNETPNILTTIYKTAHTYNSLSDVNFLNIVGKTVTVTIDGVIYKFTSFTTDDRYVLVNKETDLVTNAFCDNVYLGPGAQGLPFVETYKNGNDVVTVISQLTYIIGTDYKPISSWYILYSKDNLIFTELPSPVPDGQILSKPILSNNGDYLILLYATGPKKLLLQPGESWQNISLTTPLNGLNNVNTVGTNFNQSNYLDADFTKDDIFALVYGDNLAVTTDSDPVYNDFKLIEYDADSSTETPTNIFNATSSTSTTYTPDAQTSITDTVFLKGQGVDTGSTNSAVMSFKNTSTIITTYNNQVGTLQVKSNFEFSTLIPYDTVRDYQDAPLRNKWWGLSARIELTFSDSGNVLYQKTLTKTYGVMLNGTYVQNVGADGYFTNITINGFSGSSIQTDFGTLYYMFNDTINPDTDDKLWLYYYYTIPDASVPGGPYYRSRTYSLNQMFLTFMPTTYTYVETTNGTGILDNNIRVYLKSTNIAPKVKMHFSGGARYVAVNFIAQGQDNGKYYNVLWTKMTGVASPGVFIVDSADNLDDLVVNKPINNDLVVMEYLCALYATKKISNNQYDIVEYSIFYNDITSSYEMKETVVGQLENESPIRCNQYDTSYILTNKNIINVSTNETTDLLFDAYPVAFNYDTIFVTAGNDLYKTGINGSITFEETSDGVYNNILFDHIAELKHIYFSKDNVLYSNYTRIVDGQSKLYIPEITKQTFENTITNLHPITEQAMGIFLEDSIYYTVTETTDSYDTLQYYFKTKLQIGCLKGCDVLTTFDNQFVIFNSRRGLACLSYQQLVATTEQAVQFLSDTIQETYKLYSTQSTSNNYIKLSKYYNYIFVYKPDSRYCYLIDVRKYSWWPLEFMHNITKIVDDKNELAILTNGNMTELNHTELDYYDYDDRRNKIPWHLLSQKMYLSALNRYKHIINITFMTVHDVEAIMNYYNNTEYMFDIKLQINNYRKTIDGNINSDMEDDYDVVTYDVNLIRTYVKRFNYFKVNQFQYKIFNNDTGYYEIPLCLNNLSIKYKIGDEVR